MLLNWGTPSLLWGTKEFAPYECPVLCPASAVTRGARLEQPPAVFHPGLIWAARVSFLYLVFSTYTGSNRDSIFSLSPRPHCGYPRPLRHSRMRGTSEIDHMSMGAGDITLDLEPIVVGGCTRGSGRFWSMEAIEDGACIPVLCTLHCIEPEVSPKSERWSAVITQSSRVLPC